MNNIVLLAALFGLMTIGTASILYASFKGQGDISANYFLFAEVSILPGILLVMLSNLDPHFNRPLTFYFCNSLINISEVGVIFSIYALTKKPSRKSFYLAIFGVFAYSALSEYARIKINPIFPLLMVSLASAALSFATYGLCKSLKDSELQNNLFLKWFGRLEIGLGLFSLLRAGSYFSSTPISSQNPPTAVSVLFAIFAALCIFRYISYHSLRISWVDPRTSAQNALNINLAKALQEKEQLLHSLIASNRVLSISALANSLAHQLSQPLTGIALQTETLKRNLAESNPDEASVKSLNKISRQLSKLSELVKNLRQLFSFKTHQFKNINLQEITNEVLELVEPALNENQIQLVKQYEADVRVYGDAIQIQQVLINLFNNAIDAINLSNLPTREIRLSISMEDAYGLISIEDSGTGVEVNLLPNIFDLYKTTKNDGLGVGLWLSKTIIDKHQGKIAALNSKNGGAIFKVSLPAVLGSRS